jgi:hypothetical protein
LAKSTGGIGLRSAIKVIQDVLIEGTQGQPAVAERPVGGLVTTVTLYDALERDVRRAFPTIHQAVGKAVGVALRSGKPDVQVLARAARRLTDLVGEQVIPPEDSISKAAVKHFPKVQQRVAPLGEKLDGLGLAGGETARSLSREIADVLPNDGSDATQRLGAEESSLYRDMKWASECHAALEQGFGDTVRELQQHRRAVEALPASGVPGELREGVRETLKLLGERLAQPDCYRHAADLRTTLTDLKAQVRDAAARMAEAQAASIREAQQALRRLPEWGELTQEEQALALAELEGLRADAPRTSAGWRPWCGRSSSSPRG